MSKNSRRRKQQKRKKKTQSQRQRIQAKSQPMPLGKTVSRSLLSGWRGVVCISALASILSFAFAAWPRLSIYPGSTILKTNPFQTPFILRNDGYLPISDVEFICFLRNATVSGSQQPNFGNVGLQIVNTGIGSLAPNESASIEFERIFNPGLRFSSADIDVVVVYRPYRMPFKRSKEQGFKTKKTYNNELIWIPAPKSR